MNRFSQQLKELTSDMRLSETERDEMREQLAAYVAHTPIRSESLTRTEVSSWHWFNIKIVAPATLVAVVLVSGTVSYAAEGALPGDVLYSMKVGVNEEVRGALMISREAQVAWGVRRAERRLEEATYLVSESSFDESKQETLSAQFELQVEDLARTVAEVEIEDPLLAMEAASQFEASLLAYGEVMERIALSNEAVGEQVGKLLDRARTASGRLAYRYAYADTASVDDVMSMRTPDSAASSAVAPKEEVSALSFEAGEVEELGIATRSSEDNSSGRVRNDRDVRDGSRGDVAVRLQGVVETNLARAERMLSKYRESIGERDYAQLKRLLGDVTDEMEVAGNLLDDGLYDDAYESFRAQLLRVTRLEAYVRTVGALNAPAVPLPEVFGDDLSTEYSRRSDVDLDREVDDSSTSTEDEVEEEVEEGSDDIRDRVEVRDVPEVEAELKVRVDVVR